MATIGIIYFSGYGHTARQAQAVADGARGVEGARVTVFEVGRDGLLADGAWETLATQDAFIYGSPTYMGGPAWQFKRFADDSSKPFRTQAWKDKIAAGFTNSASVNGDKFSTLAYFVTLSLQHGQIWIGAGLMPASTKANGPDDVNWTGGFTGAMAISPADASPEEAPRGGDLETARLLGARVAAYAVRTRG